MRGEARRVRITNWNRTNERVTESLAGQFRLEMADKVGSGQELCVRNRAIFCTLFDETFSQLIRLISRGNDQLMWRNGTKMMNLHKLPPVLEDLRNHTPEQVAELRLLMASDAPSRPDPRRPGFFEVEGPESVYYIFRYPNGSKVLLLGVWERDPAAELVACSCPAA